MIHKATYLKLLTFVVIAITCFTTCKKYPENNLWFKNPEKLSPFNGNINAYIVNGVDSTASLANYLGSKYYFVVNYGVMFDKILLSESSEPKYHKNSPFINYYSGAPNHGFNYAYTGHKKRS